MVNFSKDVTKSIHSHNLINEAQKPALGETCTQYFPPASLPTAAGATHLLEISVKLFMRTDMEKSTNKGNCKRTLPYWTAELSHVHRFTYCYAIKTVPIAITYRKSVLNGWWKRLLRRRWQNGNFIGIMCFLSYRVTEIHLLTFLNWLKWLILVKGGKWNDDKLKKFIQKIIYW